MVGNIPYWIWGFTFAVSLIAGIWSYSAWKRTVNSPPWLRGFILLLWLNAKHYALAVWGIRLRLDPDYPAETRFRGDLIVDAVLEYRGYGLFVLWCPFLSFLLPPAVSAVVFGVWGVLAANRAHYYSSPFRFWTEAYKEAPGKDRNRIRYFEEISLEIERKLKAGADWDSPEMHELIETGRRIQNCIVEKKR